MVGLFIATTLFFRFVFFMEKYHLSPRHVPNLNGQTMNADKFGDQDQES